MTSIFLAGAESPDHQSLLSECGATNVAVNVASLVKRTSSNWSLDIDGTEWEWIAFSDGPVLDEDLQFTIEGSTWAPLWVVGPDSWSDRSNYLPVWPGGQELPEGREMGMFISDRAFKDAALRRRALGSRSAGTTMGVITGSIDPEIAKFDVVVSSAWWSVMKYGETQVWDGRKMHRYNKDAKDEARRRHADDIEALGVVVSKVLEDDRDECSRLAILSWMAYSDSMAAQIATIPGSGALAETGSGDDLVATGGRRERHVRSVLPIIGMETVDGPQTFDEDGNIVSTPVQLVRSAGVTVRKCDNCYLRDQGCPEYDPGARCAYDIPVTLRTKEQREAMFAVLTEVQAQRVLIARFGEDVGGQELDPTVGREIDRYMKMNKTMKEINDDRATITITSQGPAMGMISRTFGDRAGQAARAALAPVDSNELAEEILDVESYEEA